MKEYRYNNITQPNRNQLLYRDPEVDGMKTGHTSSAGYCLIASKKHDGRRLVSVVIGAESDAVRTNESAKLLGYGFNFFETPRLYTAHQPVQTVKVFKGAQNTLAVGVLQDQYVSVPRGQGAQIQRQVVVKSPLVAPIQAGEVVGSVKLTLHGQPLGELPLHALTAVPQAGVFGRMADSIRLWFY
jgi:D-alanyl-D-alanine carboxypeptidase (penicillin-binding protein 5/6)